MIPKLSLTGYTAHGTEENSWGPNKVENKLEDHCIKLGPQKIRERERKKVEIGLPFSSPDLEQRKERSSLRISGTSPVLSGCGTRIHPARIASLAPSSKKLTKNAV